MYLLQFYFIYQGINSTGHKIDLINKLDGVSDTSGLSLELYALDLNNGIQFYIHNQSMVAPNIIGKKILVSIGMETNLIFNKLEEQKLSSPYSDCQSEVIYPQTSYVYNMLDCYIFCFYKEVESFCGFSEEFEDFSENFYSNQTSFIFQLKGNLDACYALNIGNPFSEVLPSKSLIQLLE